MANYCSYCGKDNPENARHCIGCGKKLLTSTISSEYDMEPETGIYCPRCGKKSAPDAGFCMWCGQGIHIRPVNVKEIHCIKCNEANAVDALFCRSCGLNFKETFNEQYGGKTLGNRYKLGEELGRGGMGIVYKAYDEKLGKYVAIKMLPKEVARDKIAREQLKKETQVSLELTHQNIVRIYNLEEIDNDVFLVMEYIEGKTLSDMIAEKGKLGIDETLNISKQILSALVYAHEHGVVHRDLKPGNIMVTDKGIVKVLDFGIARVVVEAMTRLTGTEGTSGTFIYMSPEQMLGKPPAKSMDIYAFGMVLYEMLNGEAPFLRGDIRYQIMNVMPEKIKDIPDWLNNVIQRCTAKDYRLRFNDASEIAGAIERKQAPEVKGLYQHGQPSMAKKQIVEEEEMKKSNVILIVSAILIIAVIAVAGVWMYSSSQKTQAELKLAQMQTQITSQQQVQQEAQQKALAEQQREQQLKQQEMEAMQQAKREKQKKISKVIVTAPIVRAKPKRVAKKRPIYASNNTGNTQSDIPFQWVDSNEQSCDISCSNNNLHPVVSGQYVNGNNFYVCSANAGGQGNRAGYNVQPNWSHDCWVGYGGQELPIEENFKCLCSNKPITDLQWVDSNEQSCDISCSNNNLHPVVSGQYVNGNNFYVCSANAGGQGNRAGYNVQPNWSHDCWVGYGGQELPIEENFKCLCYKNSNSSYSAPAPAAK